MKKINKVFKTTITILGVASLAFLVASCDMLQSMLSSEQEEEVTSETGTASLNGSAWYYNGAASTNMTSTTNNSLCITFGKKTALSSSGLSGSFVITYTDASGNSTTVTKDLDGGSFSSNSKSYYLNMSPVTAMLNGSTVPSGELAVQVKVSGFVCNEGSQKGRSIDTFKKNISVAPLFSTTALSGTTFGTASATTGKAITLPLNGTATLSSNASIQIDATNSSTIPSGLTANDFVLSMSSDGTKLYITPDVELGKQVFSVDMTVSGIVPALEGIEKTQVFPVTFAEAYTSSDSLANTQGTVNTTISSLKVAKGTTGDYLVVTLDFSGTPYAWGKDMVAILIDDTSYTGSTSVAMGSYSIPTFTLENGDADFIGYEVLPSSSTSTVVSSNITSKNTWTYTGSAASATDGTAVAAYCAYAQSSTLTYQVPYTNINASATSSDTFRVAVYFLGNWGVVYSTVPSTASTTTSGSSTVTLDFDNALNVGAGTVTYPIPDAPKLVSTGTTATTASLAWTASYGATTYTLKRSTDGVTYTDLAASTTNLTYTDTGLSASTTYYYEVAATNSAGTSSYTTKTCKTSDFTVSAAAASYKSVKVSWDDIGATSYKVEYAVKADTPSYTTAASANTSTSYTITGLTAATTYYFRVTATMSTGDTVVNTATGKPYTVTLDGTLSDDEGWTDTNVAAVSTDTISSAAAYDIKDMYITNDATNLYVAVEFNSIPTFWDGYHVTILLDNNASSTGGAATTSGGWGSGVATSVTISKGSVEAQITTNNGSTTTGTCGTSWTGNGTSGYVPATAVLEYSIPLSSVGSLATGNIVYAYAAVSVYGWVNSANETGVRDHVPATAATLSSSSSCDWVVNNIASIDMTSALSYTIK